MRAYSPPYLGLILAFVLVASAFETSIARAQFFAAGLTTACINGQQAAVKLPQGLVPKHKTMLPCADCLAAFVALTTPPAPTPNHPMTMAGRLGFDAKNQAISRIIPQAAARGPPLAMI